jgi:hypothetical protein
MGITTRINAASKFIEKVLETNPLNDLQKMLKVEYNIVVRWPQTQINNYKNRMLYARLGLTQNASKSEIRCAYKKLALLHHPDKCNDSSGFAEIHRAYKTLLDPEKRLVYDAISVFTEAIISCFAPLIKVRPEDFLVGSTPNGFILPFFSADSKVILVQSEGDPLTIGQDGDIFFDYHASLTEMVFGNKVDLVLPGNRFISFEISPEFGSRSSHRFPGMGLCLESGLVADLFVQVTLTLPKTIPRAVLDDLQRVDTSGGMVVFRRVS